MKVARRRRLERCLATFHWPTVSPPITASETWCLVASCHAPTSQVSGMLSVTRERMYSHIRLITYYPSDDVVRTATSFPDQNPAWRKNISLLYIVNSFCNVNQEDKWNEIKKSIPTFCNCFTLFRVMRVLKPILVLFQARAAIKLRHVRCP